jgi:hypothetical protein
MHVGSADAAPTESEQQELRNLKQQSQELQARWAELQKSDLAAFQRLASESSLSTVVVPPRGRVLERETQEKESGSTQEEQK